MVVGVGIISGGDHELIQAGYEPLRPWIDASSFVRSITIINPGYVLGKLPLWIEVSSFICLALSTTGSNPRSVQKKFLCEIVPSPEHQLLYSAAIAL